ncbi:MAG: bifunctional heptose 7-phosphate kinase/heptose 1-phosphate adenyltransferase [Polyangiaceae bacterium]
MSASAAVLTDSVRSFVGAPIVVLGDLILDEYVEGSVRRISPEAPVQIVSVERTFFRLGGAANVAHLAATLGADTRLAGCVGRDDAGSKLLDLLRGAGIDHDRVVAALDRPTTRKLRVLAQHQQLVRLDWERAAPTSDAVARAMERAAEELAPGGALVLSDYGKGVLTPASMRAPIDRARAAGVPIVVDPKSRDFSVYAGATVLTPNLRELEDATGLALADADHATIARAAHRFTEAHAFAAVVVTLGPRGMLVVPASGAHVHIAASAREVFDVTGAGDAVIAVLALGLGRGLPLVDAATIANAAAGVVVGKLGTAVVEPGDLLRALAPHFAGKVLARADVASTARALREAGRSIVFTNGCFDVLHVGHLATLREAARHGDALSVGVNSDASVRRLKGPTRPIVGERDRAELVAAFDCVAGAVLFEEDTPLELIHDLRPDVLVKGADYDLDSVVGKSFVESYGGRVVLAPIKAGYSTTALVEELGRGEPTRAERRARSSG